ncbi:BMP family ABC transporter substrate-binding protein [Micromonospora deserti]|uniref:BMP family ABC transporter substrate-binding protein n=1 Tax=Micromonospora deserti TaxID=2070366 RepID=A0A2W2CNK2_9ACTN|nr:BMP family ABC transporter substrate-binding protein [Micromonospora deserti]PZG00163.1 BMP family ABC transporter substrate-binding protein [Micromonospora deserti]
MRRSAAGAGLAAAVIIGWVFWPEDEPEPRQREYRAETACLLTGERGIGSPEARPVWTGMQEASLAKQVKVQYLEVDGPQTGQNAETFLAGLVQNRCDVILAVGAAPVAAVPPTAARYPAARFVAFGPVTPGHNVSVMDPSDPEMARRQAHDLVAALVPPSS